LNYTVFGNGENPAGYHVVNFLLHWANACLVLVIVRRLSGRLGLAVLTAALFAVHPVNVESVTNVVGRADLLATLAILGSGWCYLRAADPGARRVAWLVALAIISCLGVLAKESAVMVVGFVVLYDWLWRWPAVPGENWRARLKAAAWEFGLRGWVALAPAVALLWWIRRWLMYHSPIFNEIFVDNPIAQASFFQGLCTAISVLGRYLGLLVFPRTLSCDYSYNQIPLYGTPGATTTDILAGVSLLAVAGLLVAAWGARRSHRLFAWGVFFFFLMLLPTSNLVVPIGSIMGERFLYLPSVGFCVVAALALRRAGGALARGIFGRTAATHYLAWAVPAFVVLVFTLRTFARNADWRDELTLWRSALDAAPNSFKTHKGYASSLWDADHTEDAADAAIAQAEASLAILDQTPLDRPRQDNTLFQDLALYYRLKGQFLDQRGQPKSAQVYYQKALAMLARAVTVDHWVNQTSRAASLARGRPADAIRDVGNYHIYVQVGLVNLLAHDWAAAETAGRYVQHLAPDEPDGYDIVGTACFNSGRYLAAAQQFLEELMLDATRSGAWDNLQKCYEVLGLTPSPVRRTAAGYSLNDQSAYLRQQLQAAAVELVHNFDEAKQQDDAATLRQRAISIYHIPASAFVPASAAP
jgi:protein O-mannosyl-transferase